MLVTSLPTLIIMLAESITQRDIMEQLIETRKFHKDLSMSGDESNLLWRWNINLGVGQEPYGCDVGEERRFPGRSRPPALAVIFRVICDHKVSLIKYSGY